MSKNSKPKTIKITSETAALCFYSQIQRDNRGRLALMKVNGKYIAFDDTAHVIAAALEIQPEEFTPDETTVSFPALLIGTNRIVRFEEEEIATVIALLLENTFSVVVAEQEK